MRKFTYFYSLLLTALFLLPWSGMKAGELKIGTNGSSTYGAPVYVTWADKYYCSQILYSATELNNLDGQQITKLAFFLRATTGNSKDYDYVQIRLMEVDYDEFSTAEYVSISGATLVFEGTLPASTSTTLEVTLNNPFVYNGGNLLVDVRKTVTGGGYAPSSSSGGKGRFQATSGTKTTVLYNYNSTSVPSTCSSMAVRPDIRFTYEEAPAGSCAKKPGTPVASDITATSAKLSWTVAEGVTNYQFVRVAKGETPDWTGVTPQAVTSVTYNDLTKFTDYDFYVRSYCDAGDGNQSAAEKVSFKTLKSCYDPTLLSVVEEETTSSSAKITWHASGHGETQWQYTYEVFDDEVPDWTGATVTDQKEATLSGLNPSTPYQVWVRSYCGTDDESGAITQYFTTACAAVNGIGWSENFEESASGDGVLPDCWQANSASSSYPKVSASSWYQKEGSTQCLAFDGGTTSSTRIAILPPFNEKTNTLYVTLDYSQAYTNYGYNYDYSGSNYGQLSIGYMTDPSDASSFVAQETLPRVNVYTTASVALTNAPDESYVALCYSGGSYSGYLYVDNISISATPSCLKPTGVSGVATAYNEASISWTANGSETAWKLQYSSDNGENWSAEQSVSENPYTLTGLSGNTSYIVRVKADCGGEESDWSFASAAFPTPCGPADASDFTETFETTTAGSGNLPACWEYSESYYAYSTTYPYVYSGSAYEGSKCLYFYGGTTASSQQTVLMPSMDETLDGLTIEFYYQAASSEWSTRAKFVVGYIAANDEFTPIETLDYAESYTLYKKALSSVPSTAKNIAIRYTGGISSASNGFIDNVKVYPTPSCVEPTGVAGANMTANSAEISWTAGGSETTWNVQYSTDGSNWTTVMDGENPAAITVNPYTLNGLAANTLYYARVKAVCSNTEASEWSVASAGFRTECAAVAANGWATGFEASEGYSVGDYQSAAPSCWALLNANDGSQPYIYVNNSSDFVQTGSQSLYFNGSGSRYGYIILPEFSGSLSTLQIVFSHVEESADKSGIITLGYLTNIADASSFSVLKECTRTTSWQEETVSLEDVTSGARLAFRYGGGTASWYAGIDDIRIEVAPTCPAPKSVLVSSITAHTAQVSWTNGKNETAWALQTSEDGTNWGAEIAADANPFTLTGLEANATYYVRVKADCGGGDESEWSAKSDEFSTKCEAKDLGWKENFDAATALPECWDNATYSGTQWALDTYGGHSGSNSARYNGRTYSSNSADLITPPIAITTNDAVLGFWFKNAVTAEVYINDGTTTTKLEDIEAASAWTEKIIDLSSYNGKTVTFIFRGHGYSTTSSKYLYVDDVRVLRHLTLADNVDNTATLAALNGQTVDVTIGRTFVCADYFNTICLPFSLTAEELAASPIATNDLWAFKYARVESGELLIRIVEAESINAGEPYLISWPAGDNIENPLFKNVTISASAGKTMGEENLKFVGTLKPETFDAHDDSKLFLYQNNTLYWWNGDAASSLKSFRAFFTVEGGAGTTPIKNLPARIIKEEQETTGIDNTGVDAQALKLLENGCVVIIRNGVKYNIQGQVIEK